MHKWIPSSSQFGEDKIVWMCQISLFHYSTTLFFCVCVFFFMSEQLLLSFLHPLFASIFHPPRAQNSLISHNLQFESRPNLAYRKLFINNSNDSNSPPMDSHRHLWNHHVFSCIPVVGIPVLPSLAEAVFLPCRLWNMSRWGPNPWECVPLCADVRGMQDGEQEAGDEPLQTWFRAAKVWLAGFNILSWHENIAEPHTCCVCRDSTGSCQHYTC